MIMRLIDVVKCGLQDLNAHRRKNRIALMGVLVARLSIHNIKMAKKLKVGE